MKKFFKLEDFQGTYDHCQFPVLQKYVDLANAKLEREGKVVYGFNQIPDSWTYNKESDTHKALLICIEPIEKCTHPVKECFSFDNGYLCSCGARVKPTSFSEDI